MARVKTVFVDMDGVVADFIGSAIKAHCKDGGPWEDPKNRGSFWIDAIWGQTRAEFWGPIEDAEGFWSGLNAYGHAKPLLDYLESKVGASRIYFLTAPHADPACYAGKMAWILEHFPEYKDRLIMTRHKKLLANKDCLLIDDADHNIKDFASRGGQAVLVPRPWNKEHPSLTEFVKVGEDDEPFKLLKRKLDRLLWHKNSNKVQSTT